PQITLVEVTTDFPSYTGKAPRTAKLADEPQAWPADTRVTFRVVSNRPLQSGTLTLTPLLGGKTIEVTLAPEDSVPFTVAQTSQSAVSQVSKPAGRPTQKDPTAGDDQPTGKSAMPQTQKSALPQIVTGSFTLTEAMLFTLGVRDVSGLDCAEPRRGR